MLGTPWLLEQAGRPGASEADLLQAYPVLRVEYLASFMQRSTVNYRA